MGEHPDSPVASSPGAAVADRGRTALWCVLAFTLGGAIVAGYLVWMHTKIAGNPRTGFCTFTETISCDKVLASPYAAIAGIPVALIGLAGFALLFALALWRLVGGERTPGWLPAGLAAVAGLGLLFELVMTWVEFFIIRAVCPYCVTALGLITATFVASVWVRAGGRGMSRKEGRYA